MSQNVDILDNAFSNVSQSGHMDLEVFTSLCTSLDLGLSSSEIYDLFADLDHDQNGRITRDNFVHGLVGSKPTNSSQSTDMSNRYVDVTTGVQLTSAAAWEMFLDEIGLKFFLMTQGR